MNPNPIAKRMAHRYGFRMTKPLSIGTTMDAVTISPKFQIVLPKRIREQLKLTPGQKIQTVLYEDRIVLVPLRPIKKMRGFLKGIETKVSREGDRV